MKIASWRYIPEIRVVFTRAEVMKLIEFSERHYDYKCRELSKCGALNGMRNMLDHGEKPEDTVEYTLDNNTAQLIAKCCENNDMELLYNMSQIVLALCARYEEMNPR